MPLRNFDKFQDVARRHGVDIEVRATNPDSLRHLEAGARPKPEWIKAKTINDLDRHLGFAAEDVGLVGFKFPVLPERPPGMADDVWNAIEDRYFQRLEEWADLRRTMDRLEADDLIRVGDDGVVRGGRNDYDVDGHLVEGGGREGEGFAGDHDVFRISRDGEMLSPEDAQPIIDELRELGAGVEHGAHRNWSPPDAKGRDTYDRIVREHTEASAGGGGEGLLRISGSGDPPTVSYD